MKPIIGIVGKPSMEADMWHYMEIVDDIRYVLIKNDALVVVDYLGNKIKEISIIANNKSAIIVTLK